MCAAQNIMNDPYVIKSNRIKTLTIKNCLVNSSCFNDYYEFNECGQISLEMPAMIGSYGKYEYDENCRMTINWGLVHTNKSDSVWRKSVYHYLSNDSILIVTYIYEAAQKVTIDSSLISKAKAEPANTIKNKKGQVTQQSFGELDYPCGIHFDGNHICKYFYKKNGLINKDMVYNNKNELIINLDYEYKK